MVAATTTPLLAPCSTCGEVPRTARAELALDHQRHELTRLRDEVSRLSRELYDANVGRAAAVRGEARALAERDAARAEAPAVDSVKLTRAIESSLCGQLRKLTHQDPLVSTSKVVADVARNIAQAALLAIETDREAV